MIRESTCAVTLACVLLVVTNATCALAERRSGLDVAATSSAWTACMTSATPASAMVRDCTIALETRDLSAFHASLLLDERGDAEVALGRLHDAIADYTKSLAFAPGEEDALSHRGIAYLDRGDARSAARDESAAIAAHRSDPANRTNGSADVLAGYYVSRGRALLALGRRSAARRDFASARELDPRAAVPHS